MKPFVPEREWTREYEPWPNDDFRHLLVVAAHPDDETLGAGGLVQHLHPAGAAVMLVVATNGEAAFPAADERRWLGRARREELERALAAQSLSEVDPIWLGLPGHTAELNDALRERAADRDLFLVPWPDDPHPDHRAACRVAVSATPVTAHCWAYPIWLWHWGRPDSSDVPWHLARAYSLSVAERIGQGHAVREFASQLKPGLSGEDPSCRPRCWPISTDHTRRSCACHRRARRPSAGSPSSTTGRPTRGRSASAGTNAAN